MYELKKIGKLFTSKFVGTGPSSYKKKRIYRAAISQKLRNTDFDNEKLWWFSNRQTRFTPAARVLIVIFR